jgi:adenosylhomocysteine nucleosidase
MNDPCWEYQAGKWASDGFKIEHYDVGLETATRTTISQFISRLGKAIDYKKDLLEDAAMFEEIVIAPMATGSAVIASEERISAIQEQHRKMAALDMEMYGVYKAAQLSASSPVVFGAKTVVDLATHSKGDQYHEYGSILSARFIVDVISQLHTTMIAEP